MQLNGSGSFGSNDHPTCPKCATAMHLIRRGPHSTLGPGYERQIFACSKCDYETERSADKDGKPHAAQSILPSP
jgi:hypothetical protein